MIFDRRVSNGGLGCIRGYQLDSWCKLSLDSMVGIHAGELLYTCRFVCACSGTVYSEEVQGSGFALPIGRLSTVTFELSCFLVLLFNLYSHERFVC